MESPTDNQTEMRVLSAVRLAAASVFQAFLSPALLSQPCPVVPLVAYPAMAQRVFLARSPCHFPFQRRARQAPVSDVHPDLPQMVGTVLWPAPATLVRSGFAGEAFAAVQLLVLCLACSLCPLPLAIGWPVPASPDIELRLEKLARPAPWPGGHCEPAQYLPLLWLWAVVHWPADFRATAHQVVED